MSSTSLAEAIASSDRPSPPELVASLLKAEKQGKRECISFSQLLGTWRLFFITGTKKVRQRAGIALGSGRYLPNWLEILLSYTDESLDNPSTRGEAGIMTNSVRLGSLKLILWGPAKYISQSNILAFDFTRMVVTLAGVELYRGFFGKGKHNEANFYTQPLRNQAFFRFFRAEKEAIAARGRGGGLALWKRVA